MAELQGVNALLRRLAASLQEDKFAVRPTHLKGRRDLEQLVFDRVRVEVFWNLHLRNDQRVLEREEARGRVVYLVFRDRVRCFLDVFTWVPFRHLHIG